MKKYAKEIILVLVTVVITSAISVYATVYYNSENVTFAPTNTDWNVTNTSAALNDLYEMNKNPEILEISKWEGSAFKGWIYSSLPLPKGYSSIRIESITKDAGVTVNYIRIYNGTKNTTIAELTTTNEAQTINLSEYKDDEINIVMHASSPTEYIGIHLNGITLTK